ncbi:helix-turn-helix domain-containing protein [Longirhabdus pacifica]|uniref:helix-turn-helix domain-containing protein n=1 Tax=Longirhabdus pacifica TaxID=2305227 RepID=UPI001008BD74|nr:helix-turn-helix transcriptional regulator [Longirhabdus pacifica]
MGERLKELREQHQLTPQEVSKIIGIPKLTYVSYEKGELKPDLEKIIILSQHYDVTVDYILNRTDDPTFQISLSKEEEKEISRLLEKSTITFSKMSLEKTEETRFLDFLKVFYRNNILERKG